ncbi:hypothetical protein AVEN_165976-1 [Araneus ventricosus]|uniref:HAT C-terminal dimerisation domain-containing protein n=1 Tax=Araneus ventricosus TaxID=182803 RepID=A0A4Y2IFF3_ARAVE|nr:hypothetical protein AVEN_165976-1 [Araneus ventricosus]
MIGLFCELSVSLSISSHSEEKLKETLDDKSSALYEKLQKAIHSKTKVLRCSTSKRSILSKIVQQEFQLLDATENRSSNIIKLCEALKTIPPTSTDDERAFSVAGLFITKLRTRLRDKT